MTNSIHSSEETDAFLYRNVKSQNYTKVGANMLENIDFSKIPIFLTAAECLNFTEAANKHYMSQSSLSKAIAAFEKSVGYSLFVRGNRKVSLTPEGSYLYKELSEVMKQVSEIIDTANQIHAGQSGSLSIAMSGFLSRTSVFEKISYRFSTAHPSYEIELKHIPYPELRKSLIDGNVDAILNNQHELSVLHGISTLTLARGSTVLLCNPQVADADRDRPLNIMDFRDHKFVCLDKNLVPGYYEYMISCCRAYGFTPNITRYASSIMEEVNYINSANYVTILDKTIVPEGVAQCCIIPIEHIAGMDRLDTVLAWRTDNNNPALQNYVLLAEEIIGEKARMI